MKKKVMKCYRSISIIQWLKWSSILLIIFMLGMTIISDLGIRTYLGLKPVEENIGIKEYIISLAICIVVISVEIVVWGKYYSYFQFKEEGIYHRGFFGNKMAFMPWEEVQQLGLLEYIKKDENKRKQMLYICKRKCESTADILAAMDYHLDDIIFLLFFREIKIKKKRSVWKEEKKKEEYWEKIVQEIVQYYPISQWANILREDEEGGSVWQDSKL